MAKNEITFSEASVRDLPVREKRYEVADIKQSALKCRITPNGVKTFVVCKFYQGSCVRTTLGRFGDITVKNARLLAIRHNKPALHDLRRTVGSYEAMNGVSLPIISKTLNHKTFQATQVYSRLDISSVRKALNTVVEQFESFR